MLCSFSPSHTHTHTHTEALAQKDGDDIMLDIFDNTQMDLEKQKKALEKQKQKVGLISCAQF